MRWPRASASGTRARSARRRACRGTVPASRPGSPAAPRRPARASPRPAACPPRTQRVPAGPGWHGPGSRSSPRRRMPSSSAAWASPSGASAQRVRRQHGRPDVLAPARHDVAPVVVPGDLLGGARDQVRGVRQQGVEAGRRPGPQPPVTSTVVDVGATSTSASASGSRSSTRPRGRWRAGTGPVRPPHRDAVGVSQRRAPRPPWPRPRAARPSPVPPARPGEAIRSPGAPQRPGADLPRAAGGAVDDRDPAPEVRVGRSRSAPARRVPRAGPPGVRRWCPPERLPPQEQVREPRMGRHAASRRPCAVTGRRRRGRPAPQASRARRHAAGVADRAR